MFSLQVWLLKGAKEEGRQTGKQKMRGWQTGEADTGEVDKLAKLANMGKIYTRTRQTKAK